MSGEDVARWAERLARASVPEEVDLAPAMAEAFVRGGADRADLFRQAGAVPGGFSPGDLLAVFPYILSAAGVAGHTLWALVGGDASNASTLIRNLDELWNRSRDRRRAKATDHDTTYADLSEAIATIETQLVQSGIEPERSELLTFRVVRALIEDEAGTRAFLAASDAAPR
jgi:hypothetical protein